MTTSKTDQLSRFRGLLLTVGQKLGFKQVLAVPIVSECVSRRLFPALIGLWIQQAVVSMDGMTEVISSILLTCQEREQGRMKTGVQ